MKYKRINRGKENRYLRTTQEHLAGRSRLTKIIEHLYWKFMKMAYCPKCKKLTKWDFRQVQRQFSDKKGEEKHIVGFAKECTNCNLQVRSGVDEISEYYVGGMFERDL